MSHCRSRASRLLPATSVVIVGLFAVAIFASENVPKISALEVIDIDYDLESLVRSAAGRPSISQPAAGTLPPSLAASKPNESRREAGGNNAADGLETRAAVASTWTAQQQIKIFGRREIYQAGFYDGMQQAFDDPLIGDWDFTQGHRAGGRDRDAYRIGSEAGLDHARVRAGEDAYARITAQCSGPSDRPQHALPSAADQRLDASTPMPAVREPRLLDVFEDLPLSSVLEQAGFEPFPDPFKLYRSDSYDDFYDRRWTDPARALDYWLDHHRDGAFWRQLSGEEKARFAKIFRSTFSRQLLEFLAGTGESAYAHGHGDGWSYGVLTVQEWRYRKGFHQGFTAALQEHARSTFNDRYPSLFDDRYGELFREWSTTARPGIRVGAAALDALDLPVFMQQLALGQRRGGAAEASRGRQPPDPRGP